jgi:hypothetical protein
MRKAHANTLVLAAVLLAAAPGLHAQDPAAPSRPRVFFDCQGPQCDLNYYRTEIAWVDWVRDAQDSNVHVIVTSQTTGAGGREYILDFIGRGAAEGYSAQSRFRANSTDTQREELDGITYTLALALAQFASSEGFGTILQIEPLGADPVTGAPDRVVSPEEVQDPWNLWSFRINASGNYSGEETRENIQINTGINASRTTPIWKTNIQGSWSLSRQEIERTDGSLLVDERINWNVNLSLVYSLAEHWSVGVTGGPARQTQQNQRLRIQANPAIEYSVFPYEEATRRAFTIFYEVGPVYRSYFRETLLGKTEQVLVEQALRIGFSQRQPWGNASINVQASSYIPDFDRHRLSLNGSVSYRILRGLELNGNASVARVKDQVYLPGEGLTEEERLLRLQQEATDYQLNGSFGISYQFGSIFNNVVNNRF